MLEKNSWFGSTRLRRGVTYPKDLQLVAVLSRHLMAFTLKAPVLSHLTKILQVIFAFIRAPSLINRLLHPSRVSPVKINLLQTTSEGALSDTAPSRRRSIARTALLAHL